MKRGDKGIIYWCMEKRDWPEDWREFIDRSEGEPCKWIDSPAQCKPCRGYKMFHVTVDKIRTRGPKK